MLISTTGTSMIWPFQTIYVTKVLGLSMTPVTILLTISSSCVLVGSIVFSPLIDRLGRKWIMIGGLSAHAVSLILLSQANTYYQFALLMGLNGLVVPIYRIAADAMVADLVPTDQRTDAYALIRLSHNLGISIGPAIGGFLAAQSYFLIFMSGAIGLLIYCLLMVLQAVETLPGNPPKKNIGAGTNLIQQRFGGYLEIFHDKRFIRFLISFTLIQFCAVLIWQILPKYAYDNFGIPENLYGWLPTTNALMVVLFQVWITSRSRHYQPLPVSAVGALFYAIAVGGLALAGGFWGFWICMVIMTIGEMLLMPTSSTYVANLAPLDKRGRYMGMFNLTWSIAGIFTPLLGGVLTDQVSSHAPWWSGFIIGLIAVLLVAASHRREQQMGFTV